MNFLKVSKEHSKQHYADFKDRPSEGTVQRTSWDNCLGRAECDEDKVGSLVFKLAGALFMAFFFKNDHETFSWRTFPLYNCEFSPHSFYGSDVVPVHPLTAFYPEDTRLGVPSSTQLLQQELKNKAGGLTHPNSKTYGKATVIKAVWYWHEDRHADHRARIESPEVSTHICSQLLFDKDAKTMQ